MEATPSSQPAQAPLRPLDLGVRAERDFEVNEFVRLFGSAADITDEQDEEMQMDTAQLKADVSATRFWRAIGSASSLTLLPCTQFSVLWNPNKRCSQLLMGPSRFINVGNLSTRVSTREEYDTYHVIAQHDCNNNVELMRNGKHLAFKVIRPIKKGQVSLSLAGNAGQPF